MRKLLAERFVDSRDELRKRQFNGVAKSVNFHDVYAPLAGLAFRDVRLRLSHSPRDFELRETGRLARKCCRKTAYSSECSVFGFGIVFHPKPAYE